MVAFAPVVIFAGGAAAGAFIFDKITGAAEDAGEALDRGGGAIIKVALVAGVGYLAFEVFRRGGFGGGS